MAAMDGRAKRTRLYLEEALLRLMEKKNVKNITVRELTGCADINRSTFYLHYSDINDMLGQMEQRLINKFYEELEKDKTERSVEEDVYHFMEVVVAYLQENRRTLLIICGKNGDRSFKETLAEVTYKQAHNWFKSLLGERADPKRVELAETFFCNGCVALLDKWLLSDELMNPRVVLRLMFQLVLMGAYGFMGN